MDAKPPPLCEPSSPSGYMKDAAVAIHRGDCTLFNKGHIAQVHGAKEVIIISNDTLVSYSVIYINAGEDLYSEKILFMNVVNVW